MKHVKVGEADVSEETGVAYTDGAVEIRQKMTRARRWPDTRMGCPILPIVENWSLSIERVLDLIYALPGGGYIHGPRVTKGDHEYRDTSTGCTTPCGNDKK